MATTDIAGDEMCNQGELYFVAQKNFYQYRNQFKYYYDKCLFILLLR